jgi:hypothetical protein
MGGVVGGIIKVPTECVWEVALSLRETRRQISPRRNEIIRRPAPKGAWQATDARQPTLCF